ncbi:MAG: hypothetical protein U5L45_12395 [Saprospiraceae bacterium]|nr:hypothetical protein [Saprospiraceae bacterium]
MVHFSGKARKMNHLFSCRCASKMHGGSIFTLNDLKDTFLGCLRFSLKV